MPEEAPVMKTLRGGGTDVMWERRPRRDTAAPQGYFLRGTIAAWTPLPQKTLPQDTAYFFPPRSARALTISSSSVFIRPSGLPAMPTEVMYLPSTTSVGTPVTP